MNKNLPPDSLTDEQKVAIERRRTLNGIASRMLRELHIEIDPSDDKSPLEIVRFLNAKGFAIELPAETGPQEIAHK